MNTKNMIMLWLLDLCFNFYERSEKRVGVSQRWSLPTE